MELTWGGQDQSIKYSVRALSTTLEAFAPNFLCNDRGYFVSTVGLDEYIRNQEKADEQQGQLRLGITIGYIFNLRSKLLCFLN